MNQVPALCKLAVVIDALHFMMQNLDQLVCTGDLETACHMTNKNVLKAMLNLYKPSLVSFTFIGGFTQWMFLHKTV